MAISKAKKKRLKMMRQHGKDVTMLRGQSYFSTHERKTKTKLETLEKGFKKHKRHFREEQGQQMEMSFMFFI
ncbi:hypothetical protein ACH0B5_04105 [Ureibacillus sp. 179-F W5.1 NHS]|uniref:Uncharacterized protein n=1 Tax=Lysinibacillus halotolerans TaxID=1368476 RepID=A0A3M8HDF4_9BACI|nr:hypothetical protein [Lysinibacillus halotolerans]RND00360.1 hypothetical protein EC501_04965 [Lysinibacillus halotolerans]